MKQKTRRTNTSSRKEQARRKEQEGIKYKKLTRKQFPAEQRELLTKLERYLQERTKLLEQQQRYQTELEEFGLFR